MELEVDAKDTAAATCMTAERICATAITERAAYVGDTALLNRQGCLKGALLFPVLQERLLVGLPLRLQLVFRLLERCLCILELRLPLLAFDQQEPHVVLVLMKLQKEQGVESQTVSAQSLAAEVALGTLGLH